MRIAEVEAIPLTAPLTGVLKTAQDEKRTVSMVLVKIETECGLEGYGECLGRWTPLAYAQIVDDLLRPKLLGRDPFAVEGIWRNTWRSLYGRSGGMLIEAMAGVDIALWDLMGKATKLPVYKLLGGVGRTHVAAYASSIFVVDESETEEEAHRLRDLGFKMVKLKVGGDPVLDLRRVKLVREVLGDDIELAVDANWAYDIDSATIVGRTLTEYGVCWLEEPLPPEDREGYRLLGRAVPIRLAAGESEYTSFGVRDLIMERSVGVIQPDVARAGGITETRRIATLADVFHVDYAPHVGFSGAVCVAATLHLAAALPNFLTFETMVMPNPLREKLATNPIGSWQQLTKDGTLPVPQEAGLGIEIDENVLEMYRVKRPE
jgi:D-galactarolactone cycloisomerase